MTGQVVHCVGVAGIGMCGVAGLLLQRGDRVSGSDAGDVDHLDALVGQGLVLHRVHDAGNVPDDATCVVHSVAVPPENPELLEAHRRGLRVLKYAEMVGELMAQKRGICVAGTHGKTTTSAMVAWILRQAGRDPSFIIGAHVPQLDGGSHSGGDDFVLESCEYDRSFHHYRPDAAIITNVDVDHLDYYADIREIQDSFQTFLSGVNGRVYLCGDDPYSQVLTGEQVTRCGYSEVNEVRLHPAGSSCARLKDASGEIGYLRLILPGRHIMLDAALAFLLCRDLGVDRETAEDALASFSGADRRFQVLHEDETYAVVDDYAHHPVEIEAVLQAAGERWPGWRRLVVFQPHQHSRTRFLLDSFAWTLGRADRVYVPDIYFVRDSERDRQSVTSRDLVRAVRSHGGEAVFVPDLDRLADRRDDWREVPTVVIVMGAGDIWRVARSLCP